MDKLTPRSTTPEQPLPVGLFRLSGWGARAQQYPVFGPTWFAYRARSYLPPVAVIGLLLMLMCFIQPIAANVRMQFALFSGWMVIATSLYAGRWLAVQLCRRGWMARREAVGVLLALLTGMAMAAAFIPFTRLRQNGGASSETLLSTAHLVNFAVWTALLLWLGGTQDFFTYLRQRRSLHDARLQDQVERYRDERNQVAMRLSLLASQVEPHFLFNTLSGVRAAIQTDPARGILIIDHLVDYLRATIPQIRSEGGQLLAPLRGQLDAARAYLGVIHTRIPRLAYRVDCDPALLDFAIPPLMLISLVENAVKHGIEPKKGPVTIGVTAQAVQVDGIEKLLLTVADDGVGFGAAHSGSGIGLSNIRERLRHLYGEQATLTLTARDTGGLEASLLLPLHTLNGD